MKYNVHRTRQKPPDIRQELDELQQELSFIQFCCTSTNVKGAVDLQKEDEMLSFKTAGGVKERIARYGGGERRDPLSQMAESEEKGLEVHEDPCGGGGGGRHNLEGTAEVGVQTEKEKNEEGMAASIHTIFPEGAREAATSILFVLRLGMGR